MAARDIIAQHVHSRAEDLGFSAPPLLITYLVDLLAQRVARVDIIPDPSFAERYLQLAQINSAELYQDYADSALFFCSLMPQYGHKRGLSMDYYATLGISSYYTAAQLAQDQRFTQLGNWFYYLQRFLDSVIRDRDLEIWTVKF